LQNLQDALQELKAIVGEVVKLSAVYETEPWGVSDQPAYLNQVLCIVTDKAPTALMDCLLDIEKNLGRERKGKWAERTIDIDILYYGDEIVVTKELKIPHKELHKRRFTLVPLNEIAPDFKHPALNLTTTKLLEYCPDKLEVKKYLP
jgi:2-amino-4-hydroxy-6-hydroxymethyldihydropteridine diphosphokinase